jgi:tRNA threonylcarbamoyl adenosine modification protein YeaZ
MTFSPRRALPTPKVVLVLLAIDTSAGSSVALVDRDRGVIAEHSSTDTRRHAEVIGELIAASTAQLDLSTLSGVAIGMGPGPFTGLRVGIAAGRVFAFGVGKPVVPIVSHDAVAFGETEPVLVVTDARRREVYWSTYDVPDENGLPSRTDGPSLCKPEELDTVVPDFGRYRRIDASEISAASVGLLAESLFAHGKPFAADEAVYVRSPDVTVPTSPKRVS